MSSHLVLPNSKILTQFVLLEEIDALQLVVSLLVDQPLFASQKLSLFIVVECDPLWADGHVFHGVALCVCDDLVVVGMCGSVEIEEIFQHFGEGLIELEYVMRLQIGPESVLSLFHHWLRLSRQFLLFYFLGSFPDCFRRGEGIE